MNVKTGTVHIHRIMSAMDFSILGVIYLIEIMA